MLWNENEVYKTTMTHQSHQTNGASLEDCHTNFFALVSSVSNHTKFVYEKSEQYDLLYILHYIFFYVQLHVW